VTIEDARQQIKDLKHWIEEEKMKRRVLEIQGASEVHLEAQELLLRVSTNLGLDHERLCSGSGEWRYRTGRSIVYWSLSKRGYSLGKIAMACNRTVGVRSAINRIEARYIAGGSFYEMVEKALAK